MNYTRLNPIVTAVWHGGDGAGGDGAEDDDDPDEAQLDDGVDSDDLPSSGRNFPGRFLPVGELFLSVVSAPQRRRNLFVVTPRVLGFREDNCNIPISATLIC